jgi:hypothetical protein
MWLNPYRYVVESIQKSVESKMWKRLPIGDSLSTIGGNTPKKGRVKRGIPLINSPVEELPQDIHQKKPSAKEEDA